MSTDPHFSSAVFAPPAPVVERGPIHAGARWEGTQRSGRVTYEVKVTLETVDLVAGTVCGLLEINGLTPDLDSLETYFTGDIIGCQSPSGPGFTTGRWGATLDDDRCHWSRFPAFRAIKNGLTGPGQTYNNSNKPYLFMRWKEQFPTKVQNIHGASFAGFYYLCCDFSPPAEVHSPPLASPRLTSPSTTGFGFAPSLVPMTRTPSLTPPSLGPSPSSSPALEGIVDARPSRPRSVSVSTFSYAAVVRGVSPNIAAGPPCEDPSSLDAGTKDEGLPLPPLPLRSSSSLPSPIPIMIPTPHGTTASDFPAPSSPPVGTTLGWRRRGSATMARSLDAQVQGDGEMERHRNRMRGRRGSAEKEREDYGIKSFAKATMTGYYFFRNSEPFQELSLRYVPQTKGGRGGFAFR